MTEVAGIDPHGRPSWRNYSFMHDPEPARRARLDRVYRAMSGLNRKKWEARKRRIRSTLAPRISPLDVGDLVSHALSKIGQVLFERAGAPQIVDTTSEYADRVLRAIREEGLPHRIPTSIDVDPETYRQLIQKTTQTTIGKLSLDSIPVRSRDMLPPGCYVAWYWDGHCEVSMAPRKESHGPVKGER